MIHFLYLLAFAGIVAAAFGAFATGDTREKIIYGLKVFGQFVGISLIMAWIFYFIPW